MKRVEQRRKWQRGGLCTQPSRYAILSALRQRNVLSFAELKRAVKMSDGNLSVHMRRLEGAGLVSVSKSFVGRYPRTEYRLTDDGQRGFDQALAARS